MPMYVSLHMCSRAQSSFIQGWGLQQLFEKGSKSFHLALVAFLVQLGWGWHMNIVICTICDLLCKAPTLYNVASVAVKLNAFWHADLFISCHKNRLAEGISLSNIIK